MTLPPPFQVHPLAPRRALIALGSAVHGRFRVTDAATSAEVATGELAGDTRDVTVTGLEPARTYRVTVNDHTAELPMPRAVELRQAFDVADDHGWLWIVSSEAIEAALYRDMDRKVVWRARTRPGVTFFALIPDLVPRATYRMVLTPPAGTYCFPAHILRKTFHPGHQAGLRRSFDQVRQLEVLGIASGTEISPPWYEPRLVPVLARRMREIASHPQNSEFIGHARAIGLARDPRGVRELSKVLELPLNESKRAAIVRALAEIADPSGFDLVLAQASRLGASRAAEYARALVASSRERALAHLASVARDPGSHLRIDIDAVPVAFSMGKLPELAPECERLALARRDLALSLMFHQMLAPGRASALTISRLLEEQAGAHSPDQRGLLVSALAATGDASGVPAVRRALDSSPDLPVRVGAVQALAALERDRAVPRLVALLGDPAPAVRRAAASGLAVVSAAGAVDTLIARLRAEKEGYGRVPRALAVLGGAPARAALLDFVTRGRDADGAARTSAAVDRAEALWGLGLLGEARARPMLEAALHSPCDYVRCRAVEGLGLLGAPGSLPALEAVSARPGELELIARAAPVAASWIRGKRPRGRFAIFDGEQCLVATGQRLYPGDRVRFAMSGVWASDPGAPLAGSPGAGDSTIKARVLPFGVSLEQEESGIVLEHEGPLVYYRGHGPQPDAIGFITVWAELR